MMTVRSLAGRRKRPPVIDIRSKKNGAEYPSTPFRNKRGWLAGRTRLDDRRHARELAAVVLGTRFLFRFLGRRGRRRGGERWQHAAFQDDLDLGRVQRFALEERVGNAMQDVDPILED